VRDEQFDFIFSLNAFEHIKRPDRALAEFVGCSSRAARSCSVFHHSISPTVAIIFTHVAFSRRRGSICFATARRSTPGARVGQA